MNCIEFLEKKSLKINQLNRKFVDHVEKSRFSVILNSDETDICRSYALYLLYWISREENANKNVYVFSHDYQQALLVKKELYELSKKIFLSIDINSEKYIHYKNGVNVKFYKLHKHLLVTDAVHLGICIDVAEQQNHIFMKFYKQLFPSLSAIKDSQLIINSVPNGFNLFYKLFNDAEEGINTMNPLRLYYWEDGQKNGDWVREKIKEIGEVDFNRRYNLFFSAVKGERKDIDI